MMRYCFYFTLFFWTQLLLAQTYNLEDYNLDDNRRNIRPNIKDPNLQHLNDSLQIRKRPVRAAAQVFGLNMGIWLFDRYALHGEYAYIGWNTIHTNLTSSPVWDTDKFSTNLVYHPLHGSLYYNAARSNGLSFWQSAPYALAGSLMWEYTMENERPSINDLVSTPMGGVALGEISFRLSSLILDDSKRGGARVVREILGGISSPMRAFTRLMDGDMWRVRRRNSFQSERPNYSVKLSAGWRYLPSDKYSFAGNSGAYIDAKLTYGNPFENDTYGPYELFSARVMLNMISRQRMVAAINTKGIIWGKTTRFNTSREITWGLVQYYDFFQTNAMDNPTNTPFELAHTGALGPGIMISTREQVKTWSINYNVFPKMIFMGGTLTDHYKNNDRDYDLGAGYGVEIQSLLKHVKLGSLGLNVEYSQIYTWNETMGNVGNTLLTIINPSININLRPRVSVSFTPAVYVRNSHYDYLSDEKFFTYESKLALNWIL